MKKIDWVTTLIPLIAIIGLCVLFTVFPSASAEILQTIRQFLGDELGVYYLIIGLFVFGCSLYLSFSKYGSIKLGKTSSPQYSNLKWGAMIFTSGLAADILFYSLCEWLLYANDPYITSMNVDLTTTYPLFHWGPIPWGFYLVLASAFGYMLHVKKRTKQKFSEACRPILGKRVDGITGLCIDLLAVFALLAGTATTFSLATPLLSATLSFVFGIENSYGLTIFILLTIGTLYTITVYFGMKGISRLASACTFLFILFLTYVLIGGKESRYIIETGITSLGNLVQHFLTMATWTDPLRETSFPQTWTIFYWAYWMVWCIATPFFIGTISKGRTIRQTILGGYFFGLLGTFTSFVILGNYSFALQSKGIFDVVGHYQTNGDIYQTILSIMQTLPFEKIGLLLLAVTMIAFYATTFDALTFVASSYSYKELKPEEEPHKYIKLFWAILLMLLPIALIFSESSMSHLQSVSIIAAFPVGFIILLIILGFLRDLRNHRE